MRFHFDGTNITVYRNEVEQGVIPYSNLYDNLGITNTQMELFMYINIIAVLHRMYVI